MQGEWRSAVTVASEYTARGGLSELVSGVNTPIASITHQTRVCTGERHQGCIRAVIESAAENRTQFLFDRDDPHGTFICQDVEQTGATWTSWVGDAIGSPSISNRSGNRTDDLPVTSTLQLPSVAGVNDGQIRSWSSSASSLVSHSSGAQVAAETAACAEF